MLSIGLIIYLIAVPLFSYRISTNDFNRLTILLLIFSSILSFPNFINNTISNGIAVYNGIFYVNYITIIIESFIYAIAAIILFGWSKISNTTINYKNIQNFSIFPTINEFNLAVIFSVVGSSILISSSDLISIYISIELQSFGVYILSTLYRNSESSTSAGLKYFLLGGLSSAIILLGCSFIYGYFGTTNLDNIFSMVSVISYNITSNIVNSALFGIILIGCGFIFKVASAPFHNWAPDVYDQTPTIVTVWISSIPKIAIFLFIFQLQIGFTGNFDIISIISNDITINVWKNFLLFCSFSSLFIGTIIGLSQYRIKRLLTYSTISHVGFILLAISINTHESTKSFLFYLIQYTITNINVFFIVLAFGYILKNKLSNSERIEIEFIDEFKQIFKQNVVLSISFSICIFSIAGIPPLIGFFAKQIVLYSAIHSGYYFIAIIAILVSVISASYYLKIIQVISFDAYNTINTNNNEDNSNVITNAQSIIISIITIVIVLFIVKPNILLNTCHLLSLCYFTN